MTASPAEEAVDLLDRMQARASATPEHPALTLPGPDGESVTWSCAELYVAAVAAADALRKEGVCAGDRVLLSMPTSTHYVAALLGAFLLGAVPATLARPPARSGDEGWRAEVETSSRNFAPALVVADTPVPGAGARVVSAEVLFDNLHVARNIDLGTQRPRYVQFTSGSTGQPKGIVLEWAAIQANLAAIVSRVPLAPSEHVLSWLPMYHDMGLFGTLLAPLYAGCRLTLTDTATFVGHPLSWFRMLCDARATITATPPSALHSCLALLARRPLHDLDLSALKRVICGSEPVSARLVQEFEEVLGPFGVPPDALKPVYGLAEATLAVTMPYADAKPHVDRVARERFVSGRASPVASDEKAEMFVAVGEPMAGIGLEIRSPDGRVLGAREVGHIVIRGASLLAGTLVEGCYVARRGEWLDTGDLGYLAGGELFVTGRSRDVIIKSGRNYSPERIEELACTVDDVQRAAAIGVYSEHSFTERIVVLAEVPKRRLAAAGLRDRLRLALRHRMHEAGYPVDEIVVVERGTLPRTSSGKVRRAECFSLYQAGHFSAAVHA